MAWTHEEARRIDKIEAQSASTERTVNLIYAALSGFDNQGGLIREHQDLQKRVRTLENLVEQGRGGVTVARILWSVLTATGGGGVALLVRWFLTKNP